MSKIKPVTVRSAEELAESLGLLPADAAEMDIRRRLNDKIIEAVDRSGLTQAQVAAKVRTSRTRLTAILHRNTQHVSTDLMLRILTTLGYRAKITFTPPPRAA